MAEIWIVDDEPSICWALKKSLTADGHAVEVFPAAEPFWKSIQDSGVPKPRLLMLDVRLPGASGIDVLRQMSKELPGIPIIMMTAFGDLKVAVDAIQGNAFEYLTKPFSLEVALQSVTRALQQNVLDQQPAESGVAKQLQQDYMLGDSLLMQQVYKHIAIAANIDVPVSIEGEAGTGKSLVAAMIHRFSPRNEGPFLAYCATTDSKLQCEADLFGIRFSNSETGRQIGLLELAADGTLVIEEVCQLTAKSQAMLLAAIESGSFTAVSDSHPIEMKARLIFTTSHNLETLVDDGDLLPALQSQLNVCHLPLPPLRQRPEDIRPLVNGFLSLASVPHSLTITEESLLHLERRPWLGNVRELRQAIQFGAVRSKGGVIQVEDLPKDSQQRRAQPDTEDNMLREATKRWLSQRNTAHPRESQTSADHAESFLYEECIAIIEETLIEQLMQELDGNRAAVAQRLGIHRSTLRQKMKRFER